MDDSPRARILCVDDDEPLLHGLRRQLRSHYDCHVAVGPEEALALVAGEEEPFAVVVSDMRMPGMNGAELLSLVQERSPDTVRILLTGYTDVDAAIDAVNKGNIFRFLCKPCSTDVLLENLRSAVRQFDLVRAERELLEQTLRGSVNALLETLSLANPAAFGRSLRVRRLAASMAGEVESCDAWQVEVAAVLSQLGAVTLPPAVATKLDRGRALEPAEEEMVARVPGISEGLLASIPRLDDVRAIIRHQQEDFGDGSSGDGDGAAGTDVPAGARIIRLATDYDELESRELPPAVVFATLRERAGAYDPAVLEILERQVRGVAQTHDVREVTIARLRVGMVLAGDVLTEDGVLLVARGHDVTPGLLAHVRNFSRRAALREPVRVQIPRADVARPARPHTPESAVI